MLDRLMDTLGRWLYPNQFAMDPGRFEGFISEVVLVEEPRVVARLPLHDRMGKR